jgi:hypothetical protein
LSPSRSSTASCTPVEAPEGTGAAARAVFQDHLGLHGRVAAAVEHFAGDDVGDGGHGEILPAGFLRG